MNFIVVLTRFYKKQLADHIPEGAPMCGIVIVENEEIERLALRSIINDNLAGVRILGEARTGAEAIRLIDELDIDLILVDISIPKPNGVEVIRYLREKGSDTRVIITTAYDNFEIARSAMLLKVDEYLLKPIRPQQLIDTIRACIEQRGSGSRCRELSRNLGELLEQGGYRKGLALVRQHLEWVYEQKDASYRELIVNFAETLMELASKNSLKIPENTLAQWANQLYSMQIDESNRHQVLGVFNELVDLLFDFAEQQFGLAPDTMQRVLNYIERNLNKGMTLDEVADNASISVCYLSRLFKKSLQVNFISYLTARRMELAKDLLRTTDLPVTSIALELSYNDVNYFCKVFKKDVGISPAAFRKGAASVAFTK